MDFGLSGEYVSRLLDCGDVFEGYPHMVRTGNGLKFTSRLYMAWAQRHGICFIVVKLIRQMQNGVIVSFNGKFLDDHLNKNWFKRLQQTRNAASISKQYHNQVRLHSRVVRIPLAELAHLHRRRPVNEGEYINSN